MSEIVPEQQPAPPKRGGATAFWSGLLIWCYRGVGGLLLLAALVVAVAHTGAARRWFTAMLVNAANEALLADLSIQSVHLDLLHGMVLRGVELRANGTSVVTAEQLTLSYNLAALLHGGVSVSELSIQRPVITIDRDPSGVWNFERIVRPSSDTSTSASPDLAVLVRSLRLEGARVSVNDRTMLQPDPSAFSPSHLELTNLHLDAFVRLGFAKDPARTDHLVVINQLQCEQVGGPLRLRDFTAVLRAGPQGLALTGMHLRTDGSDVRAEATMATMQLDGTGEGIQARIQAAAVSGPEVHYFLPDIDVDGSYALEASASFNGNRVTVSDLRLQAGDGRVNGTVIVDHLIDGSPLHLDVRVHKSSARYADVRKRLRFVPLPDLPFLDRTVVDYARLTGEPDHALKIDVRGKDRPGEVVGQLTLQLDRPILGYDLDAEVRAGDLSVFGDSAVSSAINGRVQMKGRGTTLQDLEGTTRIVLHHSTIAGKPVTDLLAVVRGNGAGVLTIDTIDANVAPFAELVGETDPTVLLYSVPDLIPEQRIVMTGELDVADPELPRYMATIRTQDLNVAELLEMPSLPNVLSARFTLNGRGAALDDLYGSLDGRVSMLVLRDRALLPFNIDLLSTSTVRGRSVRVRSDFGSVSIDGDFVPSSLVRALSGAVGAVQEVIDQRLADFQADVSVEDSLVIGIEAMDASIDVDLYETSPINLMLAEESVSGTARFSMRVRSTPTEVLIDVPQFYVDGLQIEAPGTTIYADPTSARARLEIVDLQHDAHVALLQLEGSCDSVLRINDLTLRSPRINISELEGEASVHAASGINDMAASVHGQLRTTATGTVLSIDSASYSLKPARGLTWLLQQPAVITMQRGTGVVKSMTFARTAREVVTVSGTASSRSLDSVRLSVQSFPLNEIPLFLSLSSDDPVRLLDGQLSSATVVVDGPWEQPEMTLDLSAEKITYNRAPIGTLSAALQHRYGTITGQASVVDPTSKQQEHALDITVGALPLDLRFTDVSTRWDTTAPISLGLQARSLSLAAVEPFLPAVESVRGVADAAITVSGTPEKIQLKGDGWFSNGMFLASATNIVYQAQGRIHLDNNTLHIDSVLVHNLDRDLRGGSALASGVVVFDGLSADSIDFVVHATTRTGVKVMSKASQARSPQLFGDFVVRTGDKPIRLFGKLTAPRLTGDMIVRYADVIFPQDRSSTKARRTLFSYSREAPSQASQRSILDVAADTQGDLPTVDTLPLSPTQETLSTVATEAVRAILEEQSNDFVDALQFDLNVFLEGRTLLTMNFGPLEILVADLEQVDRNVPLTFVGSFGNNSTNLRGSVRVKEGASTYKFYKPFKTSGELNFSAGGLTNPTLKLTATYEDRRIVNERTEEYKVELGITGTKNKPKIAYRVWRNGREVVGDSAKVAGDALMLILVGRTQDELFSEGQGDLVGQVSTSLSAVATSALSDVLSELGVFVQNAQLDIGADFAQSRLTLSGQLFGDVSYRVSGQIADLSGNSTFTITVPLSVLGDEEALRYLRADFSHTVNNSGNITRQSRLWEIKIGARLP